MVIWWCISYSITILVDIYMQDSALYVEVLLFFLYIQVSPKKQIMKRLKSNEIKNPKCDQKNITLTFYIEICSSKEKKNELNMLYICVIGANPKNPTKIFHVLILFSFKKVVCKKTFYAMCYDNLQFFKIHFSQEN